MTTRVKSKWPQRFKSMLEMSKGFNDMPRIIAMDLHNELSSEELDFQPVRVISGNLRASFTTTQIGPDKWSLNQRAAGVHYAQRVMVDIPTKTNGRLAKFTKRKAILTFLKDRTFPTYGNAIDAEFKRMVKTTNAGAAYVWDKKRFARSLIAK